MGRYTAFVIIVIVEINVLYYLCSTYNENLPTTVKDNTICDCCITKCTYKCFYVFKIYFVIAMTSTLSHLYRNIIKN